MAEANEYTYQVFWSQEDGEYLGMCAEFPLLSYCGEEITETLQGIIEVVAAALEILAEEGREVPAPFGTRR